MGNCRLQAARRLKPALVQPNLACMKALLTLAAALALSSTPALAEDESADKGEVIAAVDAFFEALRSADKTALASTMSAESVIFVHDRRNGEDVKVRIIPSGEHLKGWEKSPQGTNEYMNYDSVLIDGSMAHVWGPYVFLLNGKPTHCGINSMSLAKTPDGWLVSNTSFTMTALDECETLGAPMPKAAN